MSCIIVKRQGSFKVVFKSTKKKGVQVIISRYTTEAMFEKDQLNHSKNEAFQVSNEVIYADEIQNVIEKSIVDLLEKKGVTDVDIQRILLIWS